ncbi:cell growth regulator with EF hand domain protein 1 isoform X1 [Labrus mixtus]|uniref:cell growth regulator with EF hand domain protein 1 isoform X1 n=2 Tax=Labrus mixtus TaxID=508554 RepID=UPI0029C02EE2|nr:cell growth regulator with EF hand domain protein 1 isoform X1 [Labrus mixtus]
MQTGVLMECHLGRLLPCFLFLFLLIQLCPAAPGFPATQGEESVEGHAAAASIANPFGSGEEDLRLLQSFIESSLANGQGGPEISTHEQEVFYLFGLYDYEHTGFLDGLELMKLVSEYNHYHTPGVRADEQVVSLVDFLLQTQDLNQDGLLSPSELLSPSLPHSQDSINHSAPHQEQELTVEEKLSNPSTDEAAEQREEAHEVMQLQDEEHLRQEVKPKELINLEDEQYGQQIPEAPAAEQGQDHKVPVHQGQPEM